MKLLLSIFVSNSWSKASAFNSCASAKCFIRRRDTIFFLKLLDYRSFPNVNSSNFLASMFVSLFLRARIFSYKC